MSSEWPVNCGAKLCGRESIAQPSRAVPATTSMATGMIALAAVRVTFGCSGVEPGSELHHTGNVRDCFHAAERQDHADELPPGDAEIFVRGL